MHKWARRSIAWYATLKVSGLLLDTACVEGSEASAGSWLASPDQNGTISLDIGPYKGVENTFNGATCRIAVNQVLNGTNLSTFPLPALMSCSYAAMDI